MASKSELGSSSVPDADREDRRDYIGAVVSGYGMVGANILVQLLLVPLYLSSLGKVQFGVLVVLLAFINYAAIGIGFMSGGASRILGEYAAVGDERQFASTYSVTKVFYVAYAAVIAAGMVAVGLLFDTWLFGGESAEYREAVKLATLTAALYFVVQYDFAVEKLALNARKKQFAANGLQILSLVLFACTVVPWLLSGGGLAGVLACLLAGVLIARIVSAVYWHRAGIRLPLRIPDREAIPLIRRLFGKMGAGYLLYGFIVLTFSADVMLVGWLGGPAAAAEFTLIWKVAEVLIQLIGRIPEAMTPHFVTLDALGDRSRLRATLKKGVRWTLGAGLIAGIGYGLFGNWVVALWVGESQAPRSPLGYALAGAAIFWLTTARPFSVYAYSLVKLRQLVWTSGIELAAKLCLVLLLFPRFGYLAPLIAISVVHVAGVAVAYRRIGGQAPKIGTSP